MPLVTLTCHKDWYPPEVAYASSEMSDQQMHIVDFARELPAFMLAYAEKLHLEPNTPPNAIQVDIRRFHHHAVHAPDVWVHLLLTESGLSEEQQLEARDEMRRIIEAWFTKRHHTLSWALDIFFGPGRGCIMDRHGTALEHW